MDIKKGMWIQLSIETATQGDTLDICFTVVHACVRLDATSSYRQCLSSPRRMLSKHMTFWIEEAGSSSATTAFLKNKNSNDQRKIFHLNLLR